MTSSDKLQDNKESEGTPKLRGVKNMSTIKVWSIFGSWFKQ